MWDRVKGLFAGRGVVVSAVLGALLLTSLLTFIILGPAQGEGGGGAAGDISASAQVADAASDPYAPVVWEPSSEETSGGLLPVAVVPSTQLLDMVANDGMSVSDAAINDDRNVAAIAMSAPGAPAVIYAARLLDVQMGVLAAQLNGRGTEVVVVAPARVARAYSTHRGFGPVPGTVSPEAGASSGGIGVGLLTVALVLGAAGALTFLMMHMLRRRHLGADASGLGAGPAGIGSRSKSGGEPAAVPGTRFDDVAGCDEAVEDMRELVEFLRDPQRFEKVGAQVPRGALLVGPPGTGKTLLARAVAGEAGVPFYPAAGSDFVEMYVGVGPKRVREIFAKARKHPEGAIIFIDEVDAIGRQRGSAGQGGNQEHENTLNALLVQLDGFSSSNVIVLAATNRDDVLDGALTRPGRLDRKIHVPLPDRAGRERILGVHAGSKPLEDGVNLGLVARRTPGMSGADLAQVVNEACLVAARAGRDIVTDEDFDHAVAIVAMGKARTSAVVTEHDRTVTAWHEAGHTVSAMVLPDADDPVSVSIVPRGPAGGVTWMAEGDNLFLTRRRAFARLVVAMSGRAAEELLLDGEFTSGPHGDLTAATRTAMAMVTQFGMTDNGLMIRSEGLLATGAKATDATVEAVEALLADALAAARETLAAHRSLFDAIVAGLLEHETLTHPQLVALQSGAETVPTVLPPAPREYRRAGGTPQPVPAAAIRPGAERRKVRELVEEAAAAPARVYHRVVHRGRRARARA